jgi:subtilisin family serine protease
VQIQRRAALTAGLVFVCRIAFASTQQLPTAVLAADDPGLAGNYQTTLTKQVPRAIPGRRFPGVVVFSKLTRPEVQGQAVPLPEANTLAHVNYEHHRFGRVQMGTEVRLFNPETVLVKFKRQRRVAVLGVESGRELEATRVLAARPDVQFAELDVLHRRAFWPNDPLLTNQWHHPVIGSADAWARSLGKSFVRVAILDAPFQMNHPDLASNTVAGWDVVANRPVLASSGIDHSTLGAGMAAAVIGNALGIAGAGNCQVLPININGFTSEMCNAIYWAASNGVRVVNISWDGADSDAVNAAAAEFRTTARGLVAMAGLNGSGFVGYTNQPDIWCIAMTDAADNQRSAYGNHIDFAAPGWNVFSTTTNSGYAYASGTSFATPLFCGVVAVLFSINPTLSPQEAIDILKNTAVDLGQPGWDMFFGWGRIDFGAAAAAAVSTLPVILTSTLTNGALAVSIPFKPGLAYTLWRNSSPLGLSWSQVAGTMVTTNGPTLILTDPSPPAAMQFYRVGGGVQ